jgi:NAD(P)H-hydrate epimerase
MKILSAANIKELDAYTIAHEPISSIDLMERAAQALKRAFLKHCPVETPLIVFAGPGNNGGDALALARLLCEEGFTLTVYLLNPEGRLSVDCLANTQRLLAETPEVTFCAVTDTFTPPTITAEHVVIDGLFGSGLNRPLAGLFAEAVELMNASTTRIVSIDMPSGLRGEQNTYNIYNPVVRAEWTLSLQLPKLSFLFAENHPYVGTWILLDIGLSEAGIKSFPTDYYMTEAANVAPLIKPRPRFAHKGNFGHALLVAGQRGMAGASILAAKACMRAGAGLLTVHTPAANNPMLQTAVPEAMTQIDPSADCFTQAPDTHAYSAVGVGPGLGRSPETSRALLSLIASAQAPLVVDADALNILSENPDSLTQLPAETILTPHPKELERLTGPCENSFDRLEQARRLARQYTLYIIVKGAYSCIVTPQGTCYFNPTGNSGMATAGSGDVLTGILLSLLAQGYSPREAALLGTYVHGLAGDLAAKAKGTISLMAGDIVESLPQAIKKMKNEE